MHILFVCTGNICRSPVAERLTIAYANRYSMPHLRASSAGTRASIGHPIHPRAALALEELGGDASNHMAKQIKANLLDADLILTMSTAQRSSVLELAPRQMNRTFTMYEASRLAAQDIAHTISDLAEHRSQIFAGGLPDIADPIGESAAFHKAVAHEIAELLPPILELCRT